MGFDLTISVSAVTVFLQGLLSFFSPCVLPLLPVYFGYLSGGTAARGEDGKMYYDRTKVLVNTLFFVIGISFAFFVLGLGMSAVGSFFGSNQILLARIGGCIVILLGLYQIGVFGKIKFLNRERRLELGLERMAMSPLTAFLLGFVFSFAWTPCVGPALSSVLLLAASSSSRVTGFLLLGVYTLGFVIPFLAAGLFTTSLLDIFRRHRNIVRYTVKIGGVLLVLMGVMMLSGKMNSITGYLSRISQTGQTDGSAPEDSEPDVLTETEADRETFSEQEMPDTESQIVSEQELTETESEIASEQEITETESEIVSEQELTETGQETDTETEVVDVFPAIDFELVDQYGTTHRLSDYIGKTVFLNFWATWCPPCRAEMPDIQKLYEKYQQEDSEVVILGVAAPNYGSETDAEGIREFLEENGYTYPVVMDEGGKLFLQYYITAVPTTYMIDRDGNVFGYVPGSMTEDVMQNIIDQTLAGRGK